MILNFVFFILTPLAVKTLVTVKTDNSRMTTELKMINDRIQSFENAMKDFTTRQQKTANGEMMGTVNGQRDRQLEKILSKERYSVYES